MALLLPLLGRAENDDTLQQAKTHFEAGRALYQLGHYDEAVREFTAGHQLAPRPQFLLNLGQCYRKLGDLENARDMYRRYLGEVAVDDPQRPEAEEVLAVIERGLSEGQGRRALVADPADRDESPSLARKPAPPPRKPFIKRHWWIIPTAAVVVGVGVGLGVYYGTRGTSTCSAADLGCWAFESRN